MNLKEYKTKKMNDPEFAKAYEEIQPEMNVIRAIIDARISQNITQKELAEGMDMVLNISFTPKTSVRK